MRYDPETGTVSLSAGSRVILKDGSLMDRGAFVETFGKVAALDDAVLRKIRDYVVTPKESTGGLSVRKAGGKVGQVELKRRENDTVVLTPKDREFLRNQGIMDDNGTLFHVAEMFVREMAGRGLDSGAMLRTQDLLQQKKVPVLTPAG